jgi:hypothetical protein
VTLGLQVVMPERLKFYGGSKNVKNLEKKFRKNPNKILKNSFKLFFGQIISKLKSEYTIAEEIKICSQNRQK